MSTHVRSSFYILVLQEYWVLTESRIPLTSVLGRFELLQQLDHLRLPGRVAQSVTCLATDACLTADPGVASLIPNRSHTFVEIDHEIISTVILLPSAD